VDLNARAAAELSFAPGQTIEGRAVMAGIDIAILAVYFAAVVCLGGIFYRGQKSLSDFFLAGRNMPWWAAAFSGTAAILGGISFLGAPGQAFKSDLRYLQYRLATPLALFIIGWIMIPFFHRLKVFSIYEYLEMRFDLRTRLLGGAQFFLLKALYLSISIYAPSLLFVQMTGLPLSTVVLGVGIVTTLYTTLGGVKAVIWTDTLQLFILLGGLAVSGWVIVQNAGSASSILETASANGKLRLFDFSRDFQTEFTALGGLIGGTFVLLSQYGVNQAELQKMLTTTTVSRSRLALTSAMLFAAMVGFTYFLIGAGLWVFYTAHPEKNAAGLNPDRIFPKFILEELPAGIRGLVMAAVASAAMSAVSSVLNSLTTVFSTDFHERLTKHKTGLRTARITTLAIGFVCTVGALYVSRLGNLLVAATSLQNFLGGSLTGTFLLGMTSSRANARGAFYGLVGGTLAVMLLAKFTSVSWLWHGAFAAGVAYAAGWLLSTLPGEAAESKSELIWKPGQTF
jgi:SSS family transporter